MSRRIEIIWDEAKGAECLRGTVSIGDPLDESKPLLFCRIEIKRTTLSYKPIDGEASLPKLSERDWRAISAIADAYMNCHLHRGYCFCWIDDDGTIV